MGSLEQRSADGSQDRRPDAGERIPAGKTWSTDAYRTNASFVYDASHSAPVLGLLDVRPEDDVLDLGCGTGELTIQLARTARSVVGVDASKEMIAGAQSLLDQVRSSVPSASTTAANVSFKVVDAQRLVPDLLLQPPSSASAPSVQPSMEGAFSAVFSNAALHWMTDDHAEVLRSVKMALKPGGRFVGEMGGFGNVQGVRAGLINALLTRNLPGPDRDPWFFPTTKHYARLLTEAGFNVSSISLIPRPTPLPTGVMGWLRTFASPFTEGLSEKEREEVYEEVCERVKWDLRDDEGQWTLMYVRLRFAATVPEIA